MDDYGLSVAATFNELSKPEVVKTKNLVMRVDRVGQNSPVRDGTFQENSTETSKQTRPSILPQTITALTKRNANHVFAEWNTYFQSHGQI